MRLTGNKYLYSVPYRDLLSDWRTCRSGIVAPHLLNSQFDDSSTFFWFLNRGLRLHLIDIQREPDMFYLFYALVVGINRKQRL